MVDMVDTAGLMRPYKVMVTETVALMLRHRAEGADSAARMKAKAIEQTERRRRERSGAACIKPADVPPNPRGEQLLNLWVCDDVRVEQLHLEVELERPCWLEASCDSTRVSLSLRSAFSRRRVERQKAKLLVKASAVVRQSSLHWLIATLVSSAAAV